MLAGYLLFLKITLRSSAICTAVALNFSRKSLTSPFGREVANVKHIKSYHTPEVLSVSKLILLIVSGYLLVLNLYLPATLSRK